jgi:hypothetical protein
MLIRIDHNAVPSIAVRSSAEFLSNVRVMTMRGTNQVRPGRVANSGDETMTTIHQLLVLGATALALSTQPSRAGPCAQDVDRAWLQVDATIQARIAAGRSAPQSMIALLHHQPTPSSIAAAEKTLGEGWSPMEAAITALTRAHEADRSDDRSACEQALAQMQRAIESTASMSLLP